MHGSVLLVVRYIEPVGGGCARFAPLVAPLVQRIATAKGAARNNPCIISRLYTGYVM